MSGGGGRSIFDFARLLQAPARNMEQERIFFFFSNIFRSFIRSVETNGRTLDCFVPLAGRPDAPPSSDLLTNFYYLPKGQRHSRGACGHIHEVATLAGLHGRTPVGALKRNSRRLTRNSCRQNVSGRHCPHLHTSLSAPPPPSPSTLGRPC